MMDATCYESHLRFPTDIKLMWECCDWLHGLTASVCKSLGERQPRNKFRAVSEARLAHSKQRKPKRSANRKMKRRVLHLLGKLIRQWDEIRKQFSPMIPLTAEQEKRLMAIAEVDRQQKALFEGKTVRHRLVSIDRPYLRPIIRGKENKRVEFGAKVNNIQIDGISFIEHCSFEAFSEGVRLKQCVEYQQELTGVKVREIGADSIYANNANRTFCTEEGITTSFPRKGARPKVDESQLKRRSEVLQIFFGIHMANAATLAARSIAAQERRKTEHKKNVG